MELYNFKITCRKIESYLSNTDEKLTIQVSHAKLKATNFYFSLTLDREKDAILIKTVELKVGVAWQDLEAIAYLKGYFGFTEDRDISKAIEELKNALNGNEYSLGQLDPKWQEFHMDFQKWFMYKIKPCLEKELELYKMYYSIDIVYGE